MEVGAGVRERLGKRRPTPDRTGQTITCSSGIQGIVCTYVGLQDRC